MSGSTLFYFWRVSLNGSFFAPSFPAVMARAGAAILGKNMKNHIIINRRATRQEERASLVSMEPPYSRGSAHLWTCYLRTAYISVSFVAIFISYLQLFSVTHTLKREIVMFIIQKQLICH